MTEGRSVVPSITTIMNDGASVTLDEVADFPAILGVAVGQEAGAPAPRSC